MKAGEGKEVEIIRLLKAGLDGFVSGEHLSRILGISRAAVWKHIQGLKKMGYAIQASPSKGYRLGRGADTGVFNGIEISSGLSTAFVGKKIFYYDTVDSTNIRAHELATLGEPEGTAVVADEQTAGRGRIGRRWESPPGVNLYTSIILRPDISPRDAQVLTLLSAVAVAEAVSAFMPVKPAVKWPNDILMGSKKMAGILMEMDAEADRVNFVVAGIGVNVNMRCSILPEPMSGLATSIMEARGGEGVSRVELARELYSKVEKWYKVYSIDGPAPVLEAWRGYFASEGKTVRVKSFRETIEGICMGIDGTGALLLRRPEGVGGGVVERIVSGDVTEVRAL